MPLLLVFIIVPMLELAVLIQVGSWIGVLWTILIIALTAVVGVALLKRQGTAVLTRAGQRMQDGGLPANELAEGFLLALAGALLLTPGFLTDGFGFALLMPGVRSLLIGSVLKLLKMKATGGGFQSSAFEQVDDIHQPSGKAFTSSSRPSNGPSHRPETIDGEFRRED